MSSDYIREIAGYSGPHPDTPGDGEVLAELRAELALLKAGKKVPDWTTREECIAETEAGIAHLEPKVAERRAFRLKIPLDEALKQVRQEGGKK